MFENNGVKTLTELFVKMTIDESGRHGSVTDVPEINTFSPLLV